MNVYLDEIDGLPERAERVIVCGARDWNAWDRELLERTLDSALLKFGPFAAVIHGNCGKFDRNGQVREGVDLLAEKWALMRGIQVQAFPANWAEGKSAGPRRNGKMISEGNPSLVIALPGGRGTADMVLKARSAGVRVAEVTYAAPYSTLAPGFLCDWNTGLRRPQDRSVQGQLSAFSD
jgi:hypothetical protein